MEELFTQGIALNGYTNINNDMKNEATKLTEVKTEIIPQDEATALISQAINKGIDVATMEKLLDMRRELKKEKAKEMYDRAMANFQADCPTIQKTKEVKNDYGKILYAYAPIESIVAQVKEALKTNGFSYSTSMELLPDGVKVCVKVTHAGGHSEETCMQVPLGARTGIMSSSQQVAAASTFAKRYAFMNALGILTGDADNDGATIPHSDMPSGQYAKSPTLAPQQTETVTDDSYTRETTENGVQAIVEDKYSQMSIGALKVEVSSLMTRGKIKKDYPSLSKATKEELIEVLKNA